MKQMTVKTLFSFFVIAQSHILFAETVQKNILNDTFGSLYYSAPALILAVLIFIYARKSYEKKPNKLSGFEVITPGKANIFYALKEEDTSMKTVADALADKHTNIYSNLNKITLSVKSTSVLIEDKNFKNSILINRRRSRRSLLQEGDILDMGELTLMFTSPIKKHKPTNNGHKHNAKVNTKHLSNVAALVPVDSRKKTVFLSKNITFIGRSEINDIVAKVKSISMRHAKIERVAGKHKIVDFSSENGTYVNGRRIEEHYLKEGDEVSFESLKYKFTSRLIS